MAFDLTPLANLVSLLPPISIPTISHHASSDTFKLDEDQQGISPDKTIIVEQYKKKYSDEIIWESWTFDQDHHHGSLLYADGITLYPAYFQFTPDSYWLVRTQMTGVGEYSLFLYKRDGFDFSSATKKSLGDLAWVYLESRSEFKTVMKPTYALKAELGGDAEKGSTDADLFYEKNHSLFIRLTGNAEDAQGNHLNSVKGWTCAYDLQKQAFFVPELLKNSNLMALGLATK